MPHKESFEQDKKEIPEPKLTEREKLQRSAHFNGLFNASTLREGPHPQFDGMGYSMYNQTNEMADMSFLAPKKNRGDSRLVTGVTHEKDTTILSLLLNFNFETKVRAYNDKNEELIELGDTLTALLRKSRQLENYDEKRPIYYRNLLVQGTAATRERFIEQYVPKKVIDSKDIDFTKLDKLEWTDAGYEKTYQGCVSELVDGKKIFYEDIRQQDIRKQPRVYTVEYVPRQLAETIFGEMERWKNVPKTTTPFTPNAFITQNSIYSEWTFLEIHPYKVEVLEIFEPFENTYQLYLNGVPMLPVGFPLTAVSPWGIIPLAKGDLDPMNMFAYSKSIPAKTKIDQATHDEIIRLMVRKMQQSAAVPRGNIGDKIVSENIYMPGRITPDLDPRDLPPLMENPGITQADFSFFNLVQSQIGRKSVSDSLEGQQAGKEQTATEYLDLKKQQMLKLGASIDSVINWERQMAHLRIGNVIANWTKELEQRTDEARFNLKKSYMKITVDDTFEDGHSGSRVIEFKEAEGQPSPEEVYDREEADKKKTGRETRYTYIDPDWLKSLKANFYYEIIPTDKNNDKLTQMMFLNAMTQALQLFGPQSLNVEYLKKRYAHVMGEDFDKFFTTQVPTPAFGQPEPGAEGQGSDKNPLVQGMGMPAPNTKDLMMQP